MHSTREVRPRPHHFPITPNQGLVIFPPILLRVGWYMRKASEKPSQKSVRLDKEDGLNWGKWNPVPDERILPRKMISRNKQLIDSRLHEMCVYIYIVSWLKILCWIIFIHTNAPTLFILSVPLYVPLSYLL
jgi:hypothetical protein